MRKEDNITELPLGFSMAMAKNPKALTDFSNMSDAQQRELIQKCHNVTSKSEMQKLVDSITNHETT